jgi:hypothetical protein
MPARDPIIELSREVAALRREMNQMHGMAVQAVNTANRAIGNMTAKNWFVNNFAIATGGSFGSDVINQNISVPTGFTKCGIMLIGSAAAINSGPSADNLTINLKADVFTSGGNYASSGATGATASVGTEWTFANPMGGDPMDPTRTINVKLHLSTQNANWAASGGNWAQLALLVIWQP